MRVNIDWYICPVCQGSLSHGPFIAHCQQCGRDYKWREDVLNAIPIPAPHSDVRQRWELWEKLQANGVVAYTEAPELNLAVGNREDAQEFERFAQLSGRVLDVGCGPQPRPAYAQHFGGDFVGVDPLWGVQPRAFQFVQGLGEYLPFRDQFFDRVLFGTSIDHMLQPQLALHAAYQVLKSGGSLVLWYGDVDEVHSDYPPTSSRWRKAREIWRQKGISQLLRKILQRIRAWLSPSPFAYMQKLAVPDGAIDHFHFFHVKADILKKWLIDHSYTIDEEMQLENSNSRFIRAIKR